MASSLSGGLDSSSVTCVARDILAQSGNGQLPTVSLVYDKVPECDESNYINAVHRPRRNRAPLFSGRAGRAFAVPGL